MPAFYNFATLRYGGETIQSNTVRGELEDAYGIELSAVPERYRPGERIAYAATLTNSSAIDARELTLTDDLGAYAFGAGTLVPLSYVDGSVRYFVNGELQPAPEAQVGADGSIAFRGIRIPANGDAALVYSAEVNERAPLGPGALISSTARLDRGDGAANAAPGAGAAQMGAAQAGAAQTGAPQMGTVQAGAAQMGAAQMGMNANRMALGQPAARDAQQGGSGALPVFASEEIHPESEARLSFSKRLSPDTVSAGEPLTYTLTVENLGATPVPAEDGAVITDVFNPVLDITSVRYNGAAWGADSYSYDPATGAFTTVAGRLEVPAATFAQDAQSGVWRATPGTAVLEITGTLR